MMEEKQWKCSDCGVVQPVELAEVETSCEECDSHPALFCHNPDCKSIIDLVYSDPEYIETGMSK